MFQFVSSDLQLRSSTEQTGSAEQTRSSSLRGDQFQSAQQRQSCSRQGSSRQVESSAADLTLRSLGRLISEFEQGENRLLSDPGSCPSSGLLNRYLDTGLELAGRAGQQNLLHLRDSWLMRTWITLRNCALLPQRSEAWRSLCLIALYQLFFVFRHLRSEHRQCPRRLSLMTRDMQLLSRHLL